MPKKRPTPRAPRRKASTPRRKPSPRRSSSPRPRRRPTPPKRAGKGGFLQLTPEQIRDRWDKQLLEAAELRQRRKAEAARNQFKPGKRERDKLVMVTEAGTRVARGKGKKGFLVYVTKTGKKQLVHGVGKQKWKARKITDAAPPYKPNLKKAIADFERNRLELTAKGRTVTRVGRKRLDVENPKPHRKDEAPAERVNTNAIGGWDFTPRVSDRIARSIGKAMKQKSHRTFSVSAMALLKTEDGNRVIEFNLPIDKPDNIAIQLGGLKNFVRQAFYARMAREFAHLGLVTAGSANHVRLLAANKGKDRTQWVDGRGDKWAGRHLETVQLQALEWKIEQSTN